MRETEEYIEKLENENAKLKKSLENCREIDMMHRRIRDIDMDRILELEKELLLKET